MKIVTLLVALGCLLLSPHAPAVASIYDANVIERLQLEGDQKQRMRKLIAESRARRNRIFKKYGIDPNAKPHVILTVGVNGTGKTTTIGKLAAKYVRAGKKVMLVAGDTSVPGPAAAARVQRTRWAPTHR